MPEALQLRILTPAGPVVEAEVSEVTIPGAGGEFGVLPAHTPYLALVKGGRMSWVEGGARQSLAVRGGLAEVRDDRVAVLVEEVFRAADVDLAQLDAREKEAWARFQSLVDQGEDVEAVLEELSFIATLRSLLSGH